jgi:hypothetical protein
VSDEAAPWLLSNGWAGVVASLANPQHLHGLLLGADFLHHQLDVPLLDHEGLASRCGGSEHDQVHGLRGALLMHAGNDGLAADRAACMLQPQWQLAQPILGDNVPDPFCHLRL